jgi:hypothetical protein
LGVESSRFRIALGELVIFKRDVLYNHKNGIDAGIEIVSAVPKSLYAGDCYGLNVLWWNITNENPKGWCPIDRDEIFVNYIDLDNWEGIALKNENGDRWIKVTSESAEPVSDNARKREPDVHSP